MSNKGRKSWAPCDALAIACAWANVCRYRLTSSSQLCFDADAFVLVLPGRQCDVISAIIDLTASGRVAGAHIRWNSKSCSAVALSVEAPSAGSTSMSLSSKSTSACAATRREFPRSSSMPGSDAATAAAGCSLQHVACVCTAAPRKEGPSKRSSATEVGRGAISHRRLSAGANSATALGCVARTLSVSNSANTSGAFPPESVLTPLTLSMCPTTSPAMRAPLSHSATERFETPKAAEYGEALDTFLIFESPDESVAPNAPSSSRIFLHASSFRSASITARGLASNKLPKKYKTCARSKRSAASRTSSESSREVVGFGCDTIFAFAPKGTLDVSVLMLDNPPNASSASEDSLNRFPVATTKPPTPPLSPSGAAAGTGVCVVTCFSFDATGEMDSPPQLLATLWSAVPLSFRVTQLA